MQTRLYRAALAALLLVAVALQQEVEAGQGCPFEDSPCQEYCKQQGCNLGYCGHFAWIQCICRKCGEDWNWYDKVRYNPDKNVNQTELESLKLNRTAPTALAASDGSSAATAAAGAPTLATSANPAASKEEAAATATLLIPDLSETGKPSDMNDLPEENSDKFLDYLASNHERLVKTTSQQQQQQQQQGQRRAEVAGASKTEELEGESRKGKSAGAMTRLLQMFVKEIE